MSYPDLPVNRLVVNGVDLTAQYNLILLDGYVLEPPEPKTYEVDIPGGDGKLDLTESLIGDTVYNNRKQEFIFCVVNPSSFETAKTAVSNFLHGRAYNYTMTMDPGYTYHGRFSITSYEHTAYSSGKVGIIKISIDANPFKMKTIQTMTINAVAGNTAVIPSGRMRVRPTIITTGYLKVIYNSQLHIFQQGSWTLNDLIFTHGTNNLYLNNYDAKSLRWIDLKDNGITWANFKGLRLYEWYRSRGTGVLEARTWNQVPPGTTWSDLASDRWYDFMYELVPAAEMVNNVNVQYEWGDL